MFRRKLTEVAFDVYECGCGLPFQKPIYLLKVSFVALFLQKIFLMLSVRFLRRCVFQVVSVTNAFETAPDLSFPKYVKQVLAKW